MILTQILQPTCVKVPLEGKTKTRAITELVDVLDQNKLIQSRQIGPDAVFTRERTRSTGIGSAIAIPTASAARERTGDGHGVTPTPIDFESVDGKPVSIITCWSPPRIKRALTSRLWRGSAGS